MVRMIILNSRVYLHCPQSNVYRRKDLKQVKRTRKLHLVEQCPRLMAPKEQPNDINRILHALRMVNTTKLFLCFTRSTFSLSHKLQHILRALLFQNVKMTVFCERCWRHASLFVNKAGTCHLKFRRISTNFFFLIHK